MAGEITTAISRALFRAVIPSYLRQGFSSNAMIIDWRNYAPTYQRSVMLQDIRQIAGLFVGEKKQATLPRDKVISSGNMPYFEGPGQGQYLIQATMTIQNPVTGETDAFPYSRYTDLDLSPEEAENMIADTTDVDRYGVGWNILNVEHRVTMQRNPRF